MGVPHFSVEEVDDHLQLVARLPPVASGRHARNARANRLARQGANYPVVALPPAKQQAVTQSSTARIAGGGCPLAAHPKEPKHCKRAGCPVVVPPKLTRNEPEQARQAMQQQRTPSHA